MILKKKLLTIRKKKLLMIQKKKIKKTQNRKNPPRFSPKNPFQFSRKNLKYPELSENSTSSTWFQDYKITIKKMVKKFRIGAKVEIELIPQ